MIDVNVSSEELEENIKKLCEKLLPEAIEKGLANTALILEAEAKELLMDAPPEWQEDGENEDVRKAIFSEADENSCTVGASNLMGIWLHQGTGLYAVNGDGRKEVPWFWRDERTGKTKSSSGRHPFPFLSKAVENKKKEILKAFTLQK